MKRKLNYQEEPTEESLKMLKLSKSFIIEDTEKMKAVSETVRGLNFKQTNKKAKANILLAAKRDIFAVEIKQKSVNLKFSAGAFILIVKPIFDEWKTFHDACKLIVVKDIEIKIYL